MKCNLGDIERSEWCQLVKDLIVHKNEQGLYQQLLQYLKEHNYTNATRAKLEQEALVLHAARIFDNESWVGVLEFNRKYRPEVAASTRLVWIRTECCKKPGEVTLAMLETHKHIDGTAICPHCGRWAHYEILTTLEKEDRTYACE